MGQDEESVDNDNGEPKRLSIELPMEMRGVVEQNGRPRKRSSWLSEMCLGKESKLSDMELSSTTAHSSSSISGPDGHKSTGRAGGGVGSRLRASIFSVLGKLGMSYIYAMCRSGGSVYLRRCPLHLNQPTQPYPTQTHTYYNVHTLIILPVPFDCGSAQQRLKLNCGQID